MIASADVLVSWFRSHWKRFDGLLTGENENRSIVKMVLFMNYCGIWIVPIIKLWIVAHEIDPHIWQKSLVMEEVLDVCNCHLLHC